MRALLLLLVFCNLVFFMWQTNVRQPQLSAPTSVDASTVPELVLLTTSAIEAASPPALPAEMVSDAAGSSLGSMNNHDSEPEGGCYVYGAFKSSNKARAFARSLPKAWQAAVISQRVWVDQGYWVMVPAPPTMAIARTTLEVIKAKGVKDYWLVPKGRDRGVISLGLFASLRRAEIQLRQLESIGVVAEIDQKRDRALRYRVQLKLPQPPAEVFKEPGLGIDPDLMEPQELCVEPAA